jgi:drug/metabolite transporter, DME family
MSEQRQENTGEHFSSGVFFVLLATLGWSLSGIFVRYLQHQSAEPITGWQINCWRGYWMALAIFCYLILIYGNSLPERVRQLPRQALWTSAICFAIGTTFYVMSVTLADVATVSVIGAMSPLITALLSPWITGERPSIFIAFAAIMAFAGAAVIGWNEFQGVKIAGTITSFAVPFTFAVQTLLLRRYRHLDLMPAIGIGGAMAFVGAGLAPVLFNAFGTFDPPLKLGFDIDVRSLLILALMGPIQLAIPLIFYARGARHVPGVVLALLSMTDAILNPLWPWLLGFEKFPERWTIIGGAIILGAVLLSIVSGRIHAFSRRLSTR